MEQEPTKEETKPVNKLQEFFKEARSMNVVPAVEELFSDSKFIYPFKCAPIDTVLGGGIYSGKIYEVYGQPSHGKSTFALEASKAFCDFWKSRGEENYAVLWIESESVFDKIRAKYMGCPIERYLVSEAMVVEDGFDTINKVIGLSKIKGFKLIIIWDTIAAIPTKNDKDKGAFAGGIAEKPRVIKSCLSKITTELGQNDTTLIFVNQIMSSMDQYLPDDSPGGKGIKFFSSTRILVKQIGEIKDVLKNGQEAVTGIISEIFTVKNKLTFPRQRVPLYIYGEKGLDKFQTLYNFLSAHKIITVAGGWKKIVFKDKEYSFQNYSRLQEIIEVECPELKEYIDYLVYKDYSNRSPLIKIRLLNKIWEYEKNIFGSIQTTITEEEIELGKLIYQKLIDEYEKEMSEVAA